MKNKFMRIAAVMLMLCLVTTCAISGTFAKYTNDASGTDTARVAYWGWNSTNAAKAELVIDGLFADTYAYKTGTGNSVVTSKTDENVIAPGTTGSADFKFQYTNYQTDKITKPEVAYSFVVSLGDATATYCDDAIQNNGSIKWTLTCKEGGSETTLVNAGKWTDLTTAIENLDGNKDYAAGELPEAFNSDEVYTISWIWDFEGNDTTDTEMGNAQDLADCKITITITATQID